VDGIACGLAARWTAGVALTLFLLADLDWPNRRSGAGIAS